MSATAKRVFEPVTRTAPRPLLDRADIPAAARVAEQPTSFRGRSRLAPSIVAKAIGAADCASAILAGMLAHALQSGDWSFSSAQFKFELPVILAYALILAISLRAAGLHSFTAVIRPGRNAFRVALVSGGVFALFVATAEALNIAGQFSHGWAAYWACTTMTLTLALRGGVAAGMRHLARRGQMRRSIVIYGAGPQADRLIAQIGSMSDPWNSIAGVFDDRVKRNGRSLSEVPVLGNLAALVAWARKNEPDEILVNLPWGAESRVMAVLQQLEVLPANVRLVPEFARLDAIQASVSNHFGIPMLNAYQKPVDGWGQIWKRAFDLLAATLLVMALLPVLGLIALLIKLESRGPVLFRQPRFGFNHQLIEVYKFRSMVAASGDTLGTRLTARNDPRVTRVGALLRRTSLDELPQLINVIKGEMSLVGPRPHAIRTTAGSRQCDEVISYYAVRHKVKPGITGWAQVNGWRGTMEDEEHLLRRVEHDIYYLDHWSLLFDIRILFKTVWIVVGGKNSY